MPVSHDQLAVANKDYPALARRLAETIAAASPHKAQVVKLERGDHYDIEGLSPPIVSFVKKGWLLVEDRSSFGDCPSVDALVPGESLTPSAYDWRSKHTGFKAAESVEIMQYNTAEDTVSADLIEAYLLIKTSIDTQLLYDRLQVALWGDSAAKLAQLILQFMDRLKASNPSLYDRFHLPLSQFDLGCILGITNIHVSRTLTRLESDGCIRKHKSFVEIVDRDKLASLCDYKDRF